MIANIIFKQLTMKQVQYKRKAKIAYNIANSIAISNDKKIDNKFSQSIIDKITSRLLDTIETKVWLQIFQPIATNVKLNNKNT